MEPAAAADSSSSDENVQQEQDDLLHRNAGAFGQKKIGAIAGAMLLINNATGAGIVFLPALLQSAGYVTVLITFGVATLATIISTSMTAEACKSVPGNRFFEGRVELTLLFKAFLPRWFYILALVVLHLSLLSVNLVAVLLTMQVMDWTIVAIFRCSCALFLTPNTGFSCVCPAAVACSSLQDSVFGGAMVVSVGYLVVVTLVLPLAYLNLDSSMVFQVICNLLMMLIFVEWIVVFFMQGFSTLPAVGSQQGSVVGQIVLNYAFVVTVPSWLNEKRPSVSVNRVVWSSTLVSTGIYLVLGIFGALAFPNLAGADLLTALNQLAGSTLTKITVYVFPLISVASTIPVFAIVTRYNLMATGVFGKWSSFLLGAVTPWIIVIPLTGGNQVFNQVANFSSILFQIPLNLIFPAIVYIFAKRKMASLKACFCRLDGGLCEHDFVPALEMSPPTHHADATASTEDTTTTTATSTATATSPSVERVEEPWSVAHPVLKRCCAPPRPGAKFSERFAWLARCMPGRLVAWLDRTDPPAPEHSAFPTRWPRVAGLVIAVVIASVFACLMFLALSLAIWQLATAPPAQNLTGSNATNVSSC